MKKHVPALCLKGLPGYTIYYAVIFAKCITYFSLIFYIIFFSLPWHPNWSPSLVLDSLFNLKPMNKECAFFTMHIHHAIMKSSKIPLTKIPVVFGGLWEKSAACFYYVTIQLQHFLFCIQCSLCTYYARYYYKQDYIYAYTNQLFLRIILRCTMKLPRLST